MGRELEHAFFPGRCTDGQKAHEKMLIINNQQGNANQNHSEILPHTYQDSYYQEDDKYVLVMLGKIEGEGKGTTEDETVEWHH